MEWTSVKERLPENCTEVMAYCKSSSDLHFEVKRLFFQKNKNRIVWDEICGCAGAEYADDIIEATHWMPIPEAPKAT